MKNIGQTAFIFVNANFDNWKGKWEWGIIGLHVIRHKGNACITVFTSDIVNQENHISLKPLLKLCLCAFYFLLYEFEFVKTPILGVKTLK